MTTQIEQALHIIETNVVREIKNGDFFPIGYQHYKTKDGITFTTASDGRITLCYKFSARQLVEQIDKQQDLKEAEIYEEKAKTLREKWME